MIPDFWLCIRDLPIPDARYVPSFNPCDLLQWRHQLLLQKIKQSSNLEKNIFYLVSVLKGKRHHQYFSRQTATKKTIQKNNRKKKKAGIAKNATRGRSSKWY